MIELLRGEGGSCGLGFKITFCYTQFTNTCCKRIHVVHRSGVQITPSPSPPPPSPPPSPPPPAVASAPPRLAGPRRRASAHRDRPGKAPSLRTEPESLPRQQEDREEAGEERGEEADRTSGGGVHALLVTASHDLQKSFETSTRTPSTRRYTTLARAVAANSATCRRLRREPCREAVLLDKIR